MLLALCLLGGCAPAPPLTQDEAVKLDDLLQLVKERLELSAALALERWHARRDADDDGGYETELIRAAVNRAAAYALPPEVIQEFLQAQFDAARLVHEGLQAQWHKDPKSAGKLAPASADPARAIAALTEPMLAALREAYPILRRAGGRTELGRRADVIFAGVTGGNAPAARALTPLWLLAR